MVGIKHRTQGSGVNDPTKQVSVNAWQGEHDKGATADVLTDHNQALHDALGIDAATLEGSTKAQVQNHAPQSHEHVEADITDLHAVPTMETIADGTTYKKYTTTEQTKLAGIAEGANNYTHPTTGTCPQDPKAHNHDTSYAAIGHISETTGVHGVGVSTVDSVSARDSAISSHAGATTGVHGAGASTLATTANITTHAGVTTSVHGFDTSGNAPAQAHNVLSAKHGDSTAGTVARGDVITGQDATPTWKRLAKGAANQVLSMDATATDVVWATPTGGSGYRTLVVLASDSVNNNATANTLQDVNGLSFNVTSGVKYRFYALIAYTAAATTTGSRWTINGPSASLIAYYSRYSLTATTQTQNFANAYQLPAASNASSAFTTGNIAVIEGVVIPSANGTIQVRFASEVANSAITAKAGSTLEWW